MSEKPPAKDESGSVARSSLQTDEHKEADRPKVLLVIGDGAEVLDTMYPFFRLAEDYQVVVVGPKIRTYYLVIHELVDDWDITREIAGYHLKTNSAFGDIDPAEFVGLVLPGGRAPEYLRYDEDLLRITRHFFEHDKPVASICHGIQILGAADVIRGKTVATIPKCAFDAEICGATYGDNSVERDGNLICCRGKKDMAPWMKTFIPMIEDYRRRVGATGSLPASATAGS